MGFFISLKKLCKCIILGFITGIIFYGFYTVVKAPVNGLASGHYESLGDTLCDCFREVSPRDKQVVFYNKVPKCGSTTLVVLMRNLAKLNKFRHVSSNIFNRRKVDEEEQSKIVEWVESKSSPCSLDRHVYFINFARFGERPPIYINVIRDPVERIISAFFYSRIVAKQKKTNVSANFFKKKFEHCVLSGDPECSLVENNNLLQLPYFCGHDSLCLNIYDPDALLKAKQNIEKYYVVVGTLEEMNMTLQVLETTLPQFFKGVFLMYHNSGKHRNRNKRKEFVKEEVKTLLRANLSAEYELYYFAQQRLYRQYQQLSKSKQNEENEALFEKIDKMLD